MAFPPQFLDELRQRVSLSGLIARRVRLQRRGREHLGLCPFHAEKTPSFTVNDDKAFFHCFGCGAHGDAIGFVMRSEGLTFPEAVERLAQEAGLPVPATSPEERARSERQSTLFSVLEAAAKWFEAQLRAQAGRRARDYLAGRGLDEETIARFRLGWAPDARGELRAALARDGVPEALMVEAGLIGRPEGEGTPFDRFRGRVMFPIGDRRGRVIAFGGRVLGEGEPKYLNSPETPLFHKGRTLYGFAQARTAAGERGELVVAEGYMDVIALAQAGFAHAVAPLGTALTEEQIQELWRLVPEPVLCLDGDAAGERAALRAAERVLPLLKPGFSLRFALLPAGEDPDSLVRAAGPATLAEILAAARPLVDMIWGMETADRALDTPERRAGLRTALKARIARIADPVVAGDYRIEIERRLEELLGRPRGFQGQPRPARGQRAPFRVAPVGGGEAARRGTAGLSRSQQNILLATLVNHPQLIAERQEELAALDLPRDLDNLRRAILNLCADHLDLDSAELRRHLNALGHGEAVDRVVSAGIVAQASFARPDASLDEARAGWSEAMRWLGARAARDDIEAAERRLAEQMTEESWVPLQRRLRALEEGTSSDPAAEGPDTETS